MNPYRRGKEAAGARFSAAKYDILLIRADCRASGHARDGRGTSGTKGHERRTDMVQRENSTESTRLKLISLLPRLRRFAAVLAGDRAGCDALLRAACERMISDKSGQPGTPFDRWAFEQLHALWLEGLRQHTEPMARVRGDEDLFQAAFAGADAGAAEIAETAAALTRLPPQQRSAALLIYGEGFSYEEAASILDVPSHTVIERTARALAALIDASGTMYSGDASPEARVESLHARERQTG